MSRGELCAAHLPRPERAQVMRRIANRESARRVRKRKQDDMNDLSLKVTLPGLHCGLPVMAHTAASG